MGEADVTAETVSFTSIETTKNIVDFLAESRTDDLRTYAGRIIVTANLLCSCPASSARDVTCAHLRESLSYLDADELRNLILNAKVRPE